MPVKTPTIQSCPRCHKMLECRADAIAQCACSKVALTAAETDYMRQQYQGCLCVACMLSLQLEYHELKFKVLWPID